MPIVAFTISQIIPVSASARGADVTSWSRFAGPIRTSAIAPFASRPDSSAVWPDATSASAWPEPAAAHPFAGLPRAWSPFVAVKPRSLRAL